MNTNLQTLIETGKGNLHCRALEVIMPRDNGNPAGYNALKIALERGREINQAINERISCKCIDLPVTQTNEIKPNEYSTFERLSEQLGVVHNLEMEAQGG